MAVDSALKRESATNMLVPSMVGVFPGTSGVVLAEKQSATWLYSGIAASQSQPNIIYGDSFVTTTISGKSYVSGTIKGDSIVVSTIEGDSYT